jgi:hypothetical protein
VTDLAWQSIRISTSAFNDAEGRLILANSKLVAILVCLPKQYAEPEFRGTWLVEAGFGPLSGKQGSFATFEDAMQWVRERLEPH